MKIARNMVDLVGNTPLVELGKIGADLPGRLIGKLESKNPASSVKDRIGVSMIEAAEASGELTRETTVIEATSGNTGVALAWVCAVKGYRLILAMPETMTQERRRLLQALGAEVVLTAAEQGMAGSLKKAEELAQRTAPALILRQFENPANPAVHVRTTAEEIWADTDGQIAAFVAGVGTGGTITGVGGTLKERRPDIRIVAVEPEDSAVLSGKPPGPHMIQGIGAGFIPQVLQRELIDEILPVANQDAFAMTKRLAREEGILAGISAGAAVSAAVKIAAREEFRDKMVVVILPDTGERYLSLVLYGD